MASKQEIFKVYKKRGLSMGQLVEEFKNNHTQYKNSPITFAGRLDPLAEGVVLLLSGFSDDEKKKMLQMPKEYEFDFVFGFKTDTYDVLGIAKKGDCDVEMSKSQLELEVERIKLKKRQKYPPFSSKTVLGKPLHQWSRENLLDEVEIPEREIEIFDLEILEFNNISAQKFLNMIESSVSLVSGDFRQKETIETWRNLLTGLNRDLVFVKMKALVSSGTYIRGLVNEMGDSLCCGAVVYSIKRTKIGDFK